MRPLLPPALLGLFLAPLLCFSAVAAADDVPAAPAPAPKYPQDQAAKAPPQQAGKTPGARKAKTRHAKKAKRKRDVKGPVASFPGFRMLPGGESRVYVEISEKVEITEHKAEGRITYRLKGVSVPTRTNRLALETMFFQTPVSRVQLVEQDEADLDLVIELSQPSAPTFKLADSEGGVILQVDFPALPKGQERPMPEVPQAPKPKAKSPTKPRAAAEGMEN